MDKIANLRLLAAGVALTSLMPACAMAQAVSAPETSTTADEQGSELQDIIVTAQRRSESAQSVPISVAAFTAEGLAASRTLSSDDLPGLVAGLTITPNGARTPLYLRGVGNNNASASPAVLTFVDGVYMPFNYGAQAFNDVTSMEIAKGPQGTLFGRNATGGVIQITTKDPTDTPSADVELGYGNFDTITARAYVATGLATGLRLGVAAFYENQQDGWGTNLFDGSDIYRSKKYGGRAKLVYDVSDVTTVTLAADYGYSDGNHGSTLSPAAGQDFVFNIVTQSKNIVGKGYDINTNYPSYFTTKEGGASLTVKSKIGTLNFLSISSWRKNKTFLSIDYDGGPINAVTIERIDKATAVTQELQISSQSEGPFKWVAGLFYFHQSPRMEPFTFSGPALPLVFGTPPGFDLQLRSYDKADAYAGYGQASWEFLADTTLTLGARYTVETRKQRGFNTLSSPTGGFEVPGTAGDDSKTFKKPTFRASIDHKFSPGLMVFASFNRGFNSGSFNAISPGGYGPISNPVVLPETIDAYEAGFKSELFDRKLRFNMSAFQYDYTNLQQQVAVPGGLQTLNAGAARIRGVDVDIQARPIRNLDLSASASFLDPEYVSFANAPFFKLLPSGELIAAPPPTANGAKGFSTTAAPHVSANVSATYTLDTSFGTFQTTAAANYRGTTFADSYEQFPLKKRTLINLTERWESSDGRLSASIWVKNLLDQRYDNSIILLTPVGAIGQVGAPRTFGLTVGIKVGD